MMKIKLVITVQYMNFLSILGFSGAPRSFAGTKNFLFRFTSIGNIAKNTTHQIIIYIIARPVALMLPPIS